ncbi:hypothetical protein NL676_022333 [Syzygium grande]|nr:hypothetical protein NL676_022333 [Syzygium grande]
MLTTTRDVSTVHGIVKRSETYLDPISREPNQLQPLNMRVTRRTKSYMADGPGLHGLGSIDPNTSRLVVILCDPHTGVHTIDERYGSKFLRRCESRPVFIGRRGSRRAQMASSDWSEKWVATEDWG